MPKKLDEGFIKALKRAGKAYKNLHKPMTNTAASIGSDIAIGAATAGAGALTGSLSGLGTVPGAIIAGTYAVLSGLSSWKDEYKRLRALGESIVFDEKFEENFEEELYHELVDAGLTEEELNAIVKFELTEALVAGILPKIKNALSSNKLNTMKIKSLNNSIPKLGQLKMPKLKTPKLNTEDVSPLLDAAIDNNPAEMANIFDSLIKSRLSDMVENRKVAIANAIFNPSVKEEVEEEITLEDIGITEEQLENMTEEEFEQLDEISKEKLKKYVSGAAVSAYQSGYKEGNADGYGGGSNATGGPRRELHAKANKAQAKAEKRLKGIDKAVERIDDPYYGSSGVQRFIHIV